MEEIRITPGDFLKNAGIVGLKYLLDMSNARETVDFGIAEDGQALWLSREFAIEADWTDLYFKTFVKWLGPSTVYKAVLDKIETNLAKLKANTWKAEKEEKNDLKFINEKLLSNSYQSGFANIRGKIDHPEVYEQLKADKLKDSMGTQNLLIRLEELDEFLRQPLCRDTFCMKSIIYNYINRFWDGKCFLLRANAKKDMREVFEAEFSAPLKRFCRESHSKSKEICLDCAEPMDTKERVSIAFMKDMADDLTRKRSAFWNCKVDAFLCPLCAFVYALSPLGFQLMGNKFIFINTNDSVSQLISNNNKRKKIGLNADKGEDERYPSWFARMMNVILYEKVKELTNIQVILKGANAEDKYLFSVIGPQVLDVLNQNYVKEHLQQLGEHPIVKLGSEFVNVYEIAVMNIMQYRNQYVLLNRLLKGSIENDAVLFQASNVFYIQVCMNQTKNHKKEKGVESVAVMLRKKMRDSGYALRKSVLSAKEASTDECLRGTVYQLLNALSVRNVEKFMDIVMRVYCSTKLPMPDGFVEMLGDADLFQEYGYAFVLGLKGSCPAGEKEDKKNE